MMVVPVLETEPTLNGGTFGGSRVLSRASVTAMTIDQIQDDELWWGLGWFVSSRAGSAGGPLASSRAYGHTGLGVSIWVDPENDLAGAFLIHQTGPESASAQNTFLTMAFAAVVDH